MCFYPGQTEEENTNRRLDRIAMSLFARRRERKATGFSIVLPTLIINNYNLENKKSMLFNFNRPASITELNSTILSTAGLTVFQQESIRSILPILCKLFSSSPHQASSDHSIHIGWNKKILF